MPYKKSYRTVRVSRSRQSRNMKKIAALSSRAAISQKTVPPNVKTYVRSMLKHYTETKHATPVYMDNQPILPYGLFTTHSSTILNLNQIFGGITQGTGDGQRIGDKIKVNKLKFRGFINYDSSKIDNALYTHIPLYVKMFVFRRQDNLDNPGTYNGTMGVGISDLLMNGPTPQAPINKLSDFNKLLNRDVYRIFKTRTFKLGPSAPSNNPSDSAQWNNDFSFSQRFNIDLSKHVDIVKWKENSAFQTNCAFYVGFLVSFANGFDMDATHQPAVECHYDVTMDYEDA